MKKRQLLRGAETLSEFGFSEIEALVYCFLLAESPVTGYRVSHGIGKPTANTYKAIEALIRRGAITVDEGGNRLCRAVPPKELLDRLERRFRDRKASAVEVLQEIHCDESDDRIYHLSTVEQVLERAISMLGRAEEIVLMDVFPGPFARLETTIRETLKRKVKLCIQTYEPTVLRGAQVVLHGEPNHAFSQWPGQQLSLVVDAREHLLALFSKDLSCIHQAIWSRSTFLSCMQHNHLACELRMTGLDTLSEEDPRRAKLESFTLLRSKPMGLDDLRAKCSAD